MNTGDNDKQDRLLEEYRRASAAQAGAPGESTRRAILEAARAEARRRQPAANDSRYLWSAAAGVAVLGIALVLMRQVDPRPTVSVAMEQRSDETGGAPTQSAPTRSAANEEELAAIAPAAEARSSTSAQEPADVRQNRSRIERAAADAVAPPAEPARVVADVGAEKLRAHFPGAWTSASPPAMVWIVEDSRGNALRQGTLSPGESLPQIGAMRNEFASAARRASASESAKASEATSPSAGAAAPAAPAAAVGQLTAPPDWTIQVTRNAAGIPVQVAIAREDPP